MQVKQSTRTRGEAAWLLASPKMDTSNKFEWRENIVTNWQNPHWTGVLELLNISRHNVYDFPYKFLFK